MTTQGPVPADAPTLARAVLAEIAAALARLAATGEDTSVDLKSLPLSPADLVELDEILGEGEVACTLEVAGRSEVRETGFSGVWRIRHFAGDDAVAVDEIAVTRIPDILLSHPDDDRTESLAKLFAASGGKLLAYYMTFGDYDFIVISEGPYEGVAPSSIVTAASGTVVELKTTIAVPASDMKTLFSRAGKLAAGFTPAGVGPAANA